MPIPQTKISKLRMSVRSGNIPTVEVVLAQTSKKGLESFLKKQGIGEVKLIWFSGHPRFTSSAGFIQGDADDLAGITKPLIAHYGDKLIRIQRWNVK